MSALMYSLLEIIIDSSTQVLVWHQNPNEKEVPTHTFSMGKSDYLTIMVQIRTLTEQAAVMSNDSTDVFSSRCNHRFLHIGVGVASGFN